MSSYNFKIVLLGEGSVGKTSLTLRYVSNVFDDAHQSTLQASFLKKQIYLDQDQVKLSIWDTAGQEKFHALGPIYYRESNGALLVYDVLCPKSLEKVRVWAKELRSMLGDDVCIAIVANKIDLLPIPEQRNPHTNALISEALTLCSRLPNARHHTTSAKTDTGINELFISISRRK
ncbi:Ras-related protein Rab-21, partial [Fragariocoptes setiger]